MVLSRSGVASLAFLGGALVFGVAMGFVLAFQPATPDPFDKRWAELGVEEAEFVFLGNLTEREQETIRAELRSAQVVFAEHFGAIRSDFKVYVATDLEVLNERLAVDLGEDARVWFTCGGVALPAAIAIVLEHCRPGVRELGGPLAHEYFHLLQTSNRPGRVVTLRPGAFPPVLWEQLVEGSAVYASAVHRERRGRWSLDARLQGARLGWASLGPDPSHSGLGRYDKLTFIYDGGLLATEWLVARAGPEAILKFFWTGAHRAAFQGAFGLSVDAFRNDFEAHRLEVAPPFEWRITGTVRDVNDVAVEGLTVGVAVRLEGEPLVAGSTTTDGGGAFALLGPGGGYALVAWLRCPDTNDTWGHAVLVGELGEEGFVADDDGVYTEGDDGGVPFGGEDRDRVDLLIQIPTTLAALTAEHCEN